MTGVTFTNSAARSDRLPFAPVRTRAVRLGPLLVFLVVIGALLGPALIGLRTVLPHDLLLERLPSAEPSIPVSPANVELRDVLDTYYPLQHELLSRLRGGEDTAWLEDVFLGMPGLSFVGWGALSPFNAPALVLPFSLAWSWAMALRLLVAMGGAYVLARSLGCGRAAATVAGVSFGCSGFIVGWLGWPQSHVGAFVPWVLWATARTVGARRRWWSAPVLALAVAGLWLGGFPAVAAYALVAAGAYAIVTVLREHRGELRRAAVGLTAGAAGVALGTALVAFTLVPSVLVLEQFDLGYRANAWRGDLPIRGLYTFLAPGLFGDVVDTRLWLGASYVETVAYAGVVTLALGVAAWLIRPRLPGLGFFTGLTLVAAGLAYGFPPLQAALGAVPLLRTNGPTRALVLAGLGLAVAGAMGLEALLRRLRDTASLSRPAVLVAAGGGAGVLVAAVVLDAPGALKAAAQRDLAMEVTRQALEVALAAGLRAVALVLAAGVLVLVADRLVRRWPITAVRLVAAGVVALVAVDLVTFAGGWNVQVARGGLFPHTPGVATLVEHSATHRVAGADGLGHPNTHLEYGFSDVRAHAFKTERQGDVLDRLAARRMSPTRWGLATEDSGRWQPWLGLLGVRATLVADRGQRLGGLLVQRESASPLGAMTEGNVVRATLAAPQRGRLQGVQVRVGTLGRANDGELVVRVEAAGETRVARRRAASLVDLRWTTFSFPSIDVAENDEIHVEVEGTSRDPEAAVVVFGRPEEQGRPPAPAVALRYPTSLTMRPVAGSDALGLVHDPTAPPRLSAWGDAVAVRDGEEALDAIAAGTGGLPVVELPSAAVAGAVAGAAGGGEAGAAGTGDSVALPEGGTAEVVAWERDGGRVRAVVRSDGGAVLVLRDAALDGWEARIDGAVAPTVVADYLFVGVVVPPGTHEVDLRYVPPGQTAGVALSVLGLVTLLGWGTVARHRARSSPRR